MEKRRLSPMSFLLVACAVVLAWSAISPASYPVWLLETACGIAGVIVLAAVYKRFRFSGLVYFLVWVHFTILAIGAHYTCEGMPLFTWLKDALHLQRNHYDRLAHFAQGFIPAILVREFLVRKGEIRPGKLLFFLTLSVCLAVSAFWELLEWWGVLLMRSEAGDKFLGMQGDVWDAQWDMFLCLCGATAALLTLTRAHDRSMAKLGADSARPSQADEPAA